MHYLIERAKTMQKIYQVILFKDFPYETYSKDVVYNTLSLEDAITFAKDFSKKEFLKKTIIQEDLEGVFFIPSFDKIYQLAEKLNPYKRNDYIVDVYIVEVELNTKVDYNTLDKTNAVWAINEEFVKEIFSDELDKIMIRDFMPELPEDEKSYLWNKFSKENKLFEVSTKHLSVIFRERKVMDVINATKTGEDIWAMTKSNQDEVALFEQYEK